MNIKNSQNFLYNKHLVNKIISLCDINNNDTVLEIGPGKGIITEVLSKKSFQVYAVEYDNALYRDLLSKFKDYNNVNLVKANILNYNIPFKESYKIFSNIPFTITADILNKFLNDRNLEEMYLIMQYEPFIKYAGAPFFSESYKSLLYKPFFNMDILYKFSQNDFKPSPKARIVLAKFSRKEFPDIKQNEIDLYYDFISYIFMSKNETFLSKLKLIFSYKQYKRVVGQLDVSRDMSITNVDYKDWLKSFKAFSLYGTTNNKNKIVGSFSAMSKKNKKNIKIHRNTSKINSWK